MKKLTTTLRHIRRSPYQSVAAVVMTVITFFIVTVFALTALGAHVLLTYFESRPQVTAFFKDTATDTTATKLKESIEAVVAVESSQYVSKNQALEIYQDQNKDNPLLLEMVTADILPSSLEISTKNVDDLEKVAELMQKDQEVEEVVFQKDVIDTLRTWVNGIRIAGLSLSFVLLTTSLITIVIILGLKFTARKKEIETLSLLGASTWYIRAPFVYEGVLYGLLGAFLGWGTTYVVLLYLTPNLVEFLKDIPLFPVPPLAMLVVLAGELVLGTILGVMASLIATRRYGR